MFTSLASLMIVLFATGNQLYGEGGFCVPESAMTYEIMAGEESLGYAGIRFKGEEEWLDDDEPKYEEMLKHKPQLDVFYDQPWNPTSPKTITLTSAYRFKLERPSIRRNRLKEGWRDAGYVEENEIYILESEQAKLEMAQAMVRRNLDTSAVPILKGSGGVGGTGAPGLMEQFWLHAVILAGGFILIGLLVRRFFLP